MHGPSPRTTRRRSHHPSAAFLTACALAGLLTSMCALRARAEGPALPHPILFVTQVPIPGDFTSIGSTFGNHLPAMALTGRGGDLWIRYPDGTLRNLTAAAGLGRVGFQDDASIAVREPCVHWSGGKALFAMVVGAPEQQYQWERYVWQIYEIVGLGPGDTPVVTKVPHQPEGYNNVSPIYGSDDRILFTSDRPRGGEEHLYPQLDEYESAPTVTGIWSLDPATGDLFLVQHAPSGSFSLELDSFGRLVFTRWDHLQRDQQADADAEGGGYGTFNWSSEAEDAIPLDTRDEVFPEPRPSREDLLDGTNLVGHVINHFFPWMVREDGREEETLNHVGRHELHGYFARSMNDDPNVVDFSGNYDTEVLNFLHVTESAAVPGDYYGIDAPEFYTHACGQVIRLTAPPDANAAGMSIAYVTDRSTSGFTDDPPPEHSGLYRNPLALSDGTLIAVHTPETRNDENEGTRANPISRYDLRLKTLAPVGQVWEADRPLTPGITKSVSYYDPDVLVQYSGPLWELDPVEVRPRPRPNEPPIVLAEPEATIFAEEGVAVADLERYMRARDLALVVSRNVTARDAADEQQPYNLRVPGGVATQGSPGRMYDVASLQFFQGELIRGMGGQEDPRPGRRVLAQPMHGVPNPDHPSGPLGSVKVEADGSAAAFVPARRALAWQTTEPDGTPVVRERYWLTFQPGEIRACTSCHGANQADQAGNPPASNPPEALRTLLRFYKQMAAADGPGAGGTATASLADLRIASSPNPFHDRVEFRFLLPRAITRARIEVFDAGGRRLAELPLGSLAAGDHAATWGGQTGRLRESPAVAPRTEMGTTGEPSGSVDLPPGIYFARLVSDAGIGRSIRVVKVP